jgi:CMP-N-acetylneuraminic acid synthetase
MNKMKPLCVIPARRGSKRLPLKNILSLSGKPMLAYTVRAALDSGVFDQVIVSTEDEEIAKIAEQAGAIPFCRSQDLAGDLVSATDVCINVADSLNREKDPYNAIVCLQPTSPLRTGNDIKLSWEHMISTGADYLVSVTPIDPHYFHWAVHKNSDQWSMYFGEEYMKERPLLPPVFRPNGAIKIGRLKPLKEARNFFGKNLETFSMPEDRSVHVAEQFEFDLVEYIMSRQKSEE